jgi:pyrroline-5-carboxylate reductase
VTASYELVVVGGGNMGTALVEGLVAAGRLAAGDIAVVEVAAARREALVGLLPGVAVSAEVPPCESAVIAVKPADVPAVASALASAGARRLLSIAAGVTTATLSTAAGPGVAVLRAMPNTPALVGAGVSALCTGPGATEPDAAWAAGILDAVGTCERVPEHLFDAVTGLTGSGPAYVFLVAEALVDAGVLAGIARPLAEAMVTQLLVGSSALLADRGDPAALRAMVTSPGGTTAAGLRVLEERAVRAALSEAVQAAAARSRELG